MQSIAAQNNLAETAFIKKLGNSRYHIRWFTPATEVRLCGHATLAGAYALKTGFGESGSSLTFESKSGPLFVQIEAEQITLNFPAQPPKATSVPDWFINAFGANPAEFYTSAYELAVFRSEEVISALEPDLAYLKKVPQSNVIVSAPGNNCDFVSRFFAPFDGIDEDPVTGSAHCILTPYWAKRLRKTDLSAKQISPRGGVLHCSLQGDRVTMSGACELYSEATLFI